MAAPVAACDAAVEGLAGPPKAVAADAAGVVGIVCVNPAGLHAMTVSPVWGTPTLETAAYIPKVVVVSVRREDGDALKALLARGPVSVRLETAVDTGWRPIPALTAEIPGASDDRFALLSRHVDSWHYGAMDNASANATMLEVGRVLGEHRDELRRGLRLAFWSGHSHARYAASAWYADTFWADLRERCVCHVNAESAGGIGADDLASAGCLAEAWRFAAGPIRDIAGQDLRYRRMTRSHDQSFAGIGLPSALSGVSAQPTGGYGWWWHTPDDTLHKIDPARLVRVTQISLVACWRLCALPVLPFDLAATARELRDRLRSLQETAGARFDLTPLLSEVAALGVAAEQLNAACAGVRGDAARASARAAAIMAVARALIPVNYTQAGPYGVDLALASPVLPGLVAIADPTGLDPASDAAHFLRTRLVRERNRVWDALATARREIARVI